MSAAKKHKFADLDRDGLVRACLELEDELQRLRPKPALYKLGQVLAYGNKSPLWNGQPTAYFQVLSVENRNGKWHYGYQKSGIHGFGVFPEDKCRPLTATELDGTATTAVAVPLEASSLPTATTATAMGVLGAAGYAGLDGPAAPIAHSYDADPEDMF